MKKIGKYWRIILAAVLLLLAGYIGIFKYRPMKADYQKDRQRLETECAALRGSIAENLRYSKLKEKIPGELEKIEESRLSLYEKFPRGIKEEDQIKYLIGLEESGWNDASKGAMGFTEELYKSLGGDTFTFGKPVVLSPMTDGAALLGTPINIYFTGNYDSMKNMVKYLASDFRPTSLVTAVMTPVKENGSTKLSGTFTVLLYSLETDKLPYEAPEIKGSEKREKGDIFK